ncbi:SGNH/GDSL hydrolase family protein [Mycolicibacterium sp. S2-37]|nr:SGNH/GDSL hydrolase family protein [Mycolicibacterium sp. S2-37]MBO0680796.1 SGNH/GDSL hydrolase family protein [Mycolicibacterium sp. S2-37]
MPFSRYVALGDSFTEGIGDPHPGSRNGIRGWADRVAGALAAANPDFGYANFAVRGRVMDDILTAQVPAAELLEPDLVTVYAGMNDLMALSVDIDGMMERYAEGLKRLRQTGAMVLAFTAPDLGAKPLFRGLRGRGAIYNELLRSIADDIGIGLVDFWRFDEFRDPRLWDRDRVHLSPLGHEVMAGRVLEALPAAAADAAAPTFVPMPTPSTTAFANMRWAAAFAAPWIVRRLRRMTPGDGVEPKSTALTRVR